MFRTKTPVLLAFLALSACASSTSPEDAQMANNMCAQGKALLTANKPTDARDLYASAVRRDENSARAWNGLGASYDLLGKRAQALDAYQHAVDLAPADITANNNLAHLYVEMGQPDKAIEILQPLADDRSAPPTVQQNLTAAIHASETKKEVEGDVYAEVGSYPTDGMAQGHLREAKQLLGRHARDLTFTIVPEVKTGGGVPSFTVKITGRNPGEVCEDLAAQAYTCIPHGQEPK